MPDHSVQRNEEDRRENMREAEKRARRGARIRELISLAERGGTHH